MKSLQEIDSLVAEAEKELARLDSDRMTILEHLQDVRQQQMSMLARSVQPGPDSSPAHVTNQSLPEE